MSDQLFSERGNWYSCPLTDVLQFLVFSSISQACPLVTITSSLCSGELRPHLLEAFSWRVFGAAAVPALRLPLDRCPSFSLSKCVHRSISIWIPLLSLGPWCFSQTRLDYARVTHIVEVSVAQFNKGVFLPHTESNLMFLFGYLF